MAILVYIKTNKIIMPDIPIVGGQVINAADVNETYYDADNGNRIRFNNVVYSYTETDRLAIATPISGTLYIVEATAKLYKYKLEIGWIRLETNADMYDIIDIVEELVPGTVYRDGVKIAPRTLATAVYTSKGERVEDKLNAISKIGTVSDYYTIPNDNLLEFNIPIPFPNYFELGNFVEIYIGSVLFDSRRYQIQNNKLILFAADKQFTTGRDITFRFLYNSSTPPTSVTYYIDGGYIIDKSIPSTKLSNLYDNYDIANPKLIPSMLALNSAYTVLNDKLNSIAGNLIAHAISTGITGRALTATIPNFTLSDNSTIYLKLHINIEAGATLSVNGGTAYPIYLNYKEPILRGLLEGDTLSLTFSAMYNKFFVNSSVAYKLQHYKYTYTAKGGESEIVVDINEFEPNYDELKVYQNSVRLVEDVHYRISNRRIIFIGYNAEIGDIFLFEIDKVKGNGLPTDGNTIMKELVFTEKVYFKNGINITNNLDIKGNINLDGELHFSGGASSGSNFRAEQFESTGLSPLPPLIVASNIMVANLNADLLDGYHAVDLLKPDNTVEFIIDGETDVLDPELQITFNSFYGRIDALDVRMVIKENPDRPQAVKRNLLDTIPLNTIDPKDPLSISVVQDTVEDIVWKLDNLTYQMLASEVCEYAIASLNNMSGGEIRPGAHKDPTYTQFFNNIAEINKTIDTALFNIENVMIITADSNYTEPKSPRVMAAARRSINNTPISKTYAEVPKIIAKAGTQATATKAKYLMTGDKRIYPITHKNAIIGLPNAPLATKFDIERLIQKLDELTARVAKLETPTPPTPPVV